MVQQRPIFGSKCLVSSLPPADILSQVVSNSNPTGNLTNLDLKKMAVVLLHYMVLHQKITNMKHKCAGTFLDNTLTVSWSMRMVACSKLATTGYLLQGLAARSRGQPRLAPTQWHMWPGNRMGWPMWPQEDFIYLRMSHVFSPILKKLSPSSATILEKLCMLWPKQISNLILMLGGKRLLLPRWKTHG